MADREPRPISDYPKPQVERPFGCAGVLLESIGQFTMAGATAAVAMVKGPPGWLLAALAVAGGVLCFIVVAWLRDQTRW